MSDFTRFFWDSNACCRLVESYEDWQWVVRNCEAHGTGICTVDQILEGHQAMRQPEDSVDKFGYRLEYRGDGITLEEWAKGHGMDLRGRAHP